MKKKLFLVTLMVALFVCIFAVSASAATIPDWTEITEVSGMPDKSVFGTDGIKGATSRVLMSDGITYPAYYICKNTSSLDISFSDLNTNTGKGYTEADIIRIELPKGLVTVTDELKVKNGYTALKTIVVPEGVTTLNEHAFRSVDASTHSELVKVTLPSTLTTIKSYAFAYCDSLEELIIPEGVTSIPSNMAHSTFALTTLVLPSTITSIGETAFRSSNLSNGIVIPEGCTTIVKNAFRGCSAVTVTIPSTLTTVGEYAFAENPALTTVNSKSTIIGSYMFSSCTELQFVNLENTVTIENQAFNNPTLSKIENFVLPDTLESIGSYVLPRASIKELVLPASLTSIGDNAFKDCKSLEKVIVLGTKTGSNMFAGCSALNTLVLTERFTTFGSGCLANVSSTSFTTYYTGTDYERIRTMGKSISDRFDSDKGGTNKGTSYCSYADYLDGNYRSHKYMFIYDINLCVAAFGGNHTAPMDDGDCTTALNCKYCETYVIREAKTHFAGERISYLSFMEAGKHYIGCINEGCEFGETKDAEALFTCLGYSAPESGNGGLAVGYLVNDVAILEYERVTGKTMTYGVFAVLMGRVGDEEIFNEKGEAIPGTVNVEISQLDYSAFILKITGFSEDQKDTQIAMGAYTAVIEGATVKYSYLQPTAPENGKKYSSVSYNDVVKASAEE